MNYAIYYRFVPPQPINEGFYNSIKSDIDKNIKVIFLDRPNFIPPLTIAAIGYGVCLIFYGLYWVRSKVVTDNYFTYPDNPAGTLFAYWSIPVFYLIYKYIFELCCSFNFNRKVTKFIRKSNNYIEFRTKYRNSYKV